MARANDDGRSLEREQHRQTDYLEATGRSAEVTSAHGHSHGSDATPPPKPGPREII